MAEITAVTSDYVPGKKIVKVIGTVWGGITVRSRGGLGGNIMASLRSLAGGGEINEYVKMLNDARSVAVQRLMDRASSMGANAVISLRFDSSDIAQVMTEIVAYGTAVVVEDGSSDATYVKLD
ncbi:heavy metal-binding domain-containing protein [Thermogymnomonas acidicola]|uniref:heavy metal-binding domain-containing protein n=1 Tax=Thermogymnomonas acidicola TaxID=399579 RepID=UPI0009463AD6|nr:heavy metal-binding domain-containing protein [Thermogymnomonas acidicola]